ncbi:MAG: regulatory protein RecX [Lentisphaeria bacterium]|nr:regulatory protein RecX [Lentisphaeria bacterium]
MSKADLSADEACREGALRLLDLRAHAVSELKTKLRKRGHEIQCVDSVLADFLRVGLLDDQAFARAFCEERARTKNIGRRRMLADLRKRGVDPETAEDALADVWDTGDDEFARARAAATAKWRSVRRRTEDVRAAKQKVARFLASRGFPFDVLHQVLDELDTGEQPISS